MTKSGKKLGIEIRIGIALKMLRKSHKLTQKELAEKVGVTQSNISLLEGGARSSNFSLITLERIAEALGNQRLSQLIKFAEDIPSPSEVLRRADEF